MKKTVLFLVLSASFCLQLFAQNYIDIAKFNYAYLPNIPMGDSKHKTDNQDVELSLLYPIKISKKFSIITGLDFSNQNISVTSKGGALNLYSFGMRIGAHMKHSEKWSGLYIAIPKLAGDLGRISNKDFQIGGVALWKYSKKRNLKYKFGMYASSERFGVIAIPIIGGYYRSSNKKLELNISLPVAFDFNYKVAKSVRLGADFNSIVRSYDLNQNTLSSFYIHRWVKELCAYMQFDFLRESLILKTKFVYAMNDFALYEDGDQITVAIPAKEIGDDRTRVNEEFGKVFGVKASLIYRFQMKSN